MEPFKEFWIVWNERGGAPPHEHTSIKSAKKDAERLAIENPGEAFIVFEAIGVCRKKMEKSK